MKMWKGGELVVVTPIYEDVEASRHLFKELAASLGPDVYIVAVDDGSVRQPVDVSGIEFVGLNGVVIKLTRNVGHQLAIAIGLNYVLKNLPNVQRIVVMDADGGDIPSSIHDLIQPLDSDDIDIVVAQRKRRPETLKFRVLYIVYKLIFTLFSGKKINFGNFMAMKPAALMRLVTMQELSIHIAGCVLKSKLRIATFPLDRGSRYAGQSKMNFVGLALHGFKALMVFADDVFVRVGFSCAGVSALSIIGGVITVALKLYGFATPGWFSIVLGILFLVFLQTGILTLLTLLLSGVVRSISATPISYGDFIDKVLHAKSISAGKS
jgi:glycosyltransferase involved in cell wall biosynthesis